MLGTDTLRVAIIGAGPAGIGAGRELLRKGFTEFTIFDALDAPGGTWRLHSYPGLACDVWAHSYTFSYAPNPDWSASFVGQPEIQSYLARCAEEFGLTPHITLNTRIVSAHYRDGGAWRLQTGGGETHEFDVVINAMGNQHTPLYPDVPGMDSFAGESWHGAAPTACVSMGILAHRNHACYSGAGSEISQLWTISGPRSGLSAV